LMRDRLLSPPRCAMGNACSRAPSEPAIQRTVQTVEASWSTARLAPAGSSACSLPPSAPSSSQESLCSVDDKPPRAEPAADSVDAAAESLEAAAESVEAVAVDGGDAAAAATTVGDVEVEVELEQVGEVEQVAPAASRDGRRSEDASSQAAASTSRPCLAKLLPDPKDKHAGVVPAAEWEPLSDGELEVVRAIRGWLGEETAAACPRDLLVTFTRGYAYRPDWSQASFVFLERALAWREEMGAGSICFGAPPARRELFEELCPSGLIGHDSLGHLVVLERFGRVRVTELLKAFSEEEYLRQQAFSREAVRLLSTANSTRLGRRLYKVVVVIDVEGLSLSHVGPRFVRLCKRVNETFGWHYPDDP